jgi:uncharacterized protein YegP (UPF0339 family)
MNHTFIVYRDHTDGWRWRLKEKQSGKIVCSSSEAYATKANAIRNIRSLRVAVPLARIKVQ